jgi:hypothetical protein
MLDSPDWVCNVSDMASFVGYVAAIRHLKRRGMKMNIGALRSRVSRRTIPHRRRQGDGVVMFDLDALDRWLMGEEVPIGKPAPGQGEQESESAQREAA